MATPNPRAERRTDALSKARIVDAAIELLDAGGGDALTFRALAERLATGSGALYWHVANKDELLAAATHEVVSRAMHVPGSKAAPRKALRAVALGVFEAIDAHPWAGTQLARAPWQSAMVEIFEAIGRQLHALGLAESAQFDAASVLVNYILGVAAQNAANARLHAQGTDRAAFLGDVGARWAQLDRAAYPFVHRVAHQLPAHDDRAQFLLGIDWVVDGIMGD